MFSTEDRMFHKTSTEEFERVIQDKIDNEIISDIFSKTNPKTFKDSFTREVKNDSTLINVDDINKEYLSLIHI